MLKEEKILEDYLKKKKLKHSEQRNEILRIFVDSEKHLTTDELYRIMKDKYSNIGHTTVYRTLKLLCECGLCRELKFEEGISRYEHLCDNEHHDHLICTKCGRFIDVYDPKIEELQKKLSEKYRFHQEHHRMEIYGVCSKCKKNKN